MSLSNLKTKKEVKDYRKQQPEEFTVWKVVKRIDGTPLFRTPGSGEPKLERPGRIYKARFFPKNKMKLEYEPGFHAFRTKQQARRYHSKSCWTGVERLRKFKARAEWITQIGKANGIECLVISYIKVPAETL